jgi:general secretion pathway protein A
MGDYLKFWKADTAVFLREVPSGSLFLTPVLRQSLDLLHLFCTTESPHLIVLTGGCGSGKSTLLRWLGAVLPTSTHELVTLSLVSDEYGAGWLAPRLASLLGASSKDQDPRLALEFVAQRLDELADQKRHMIVAVDSAHLIRSRAGFHEILAILNIQALSVRCVTFVIAGEPPMMDSLAEVPSLTGKIALHVSLAPLSLDETRDYLAHRLRLAGIPDPFEDEALRMISVRTKGIMLSMDIYAEHCLIEAAAQGVNRITAAVAERAARHLLSSHTHAQDAAGHPSHLADHDWRGTDVFLSSQSLVTTHPPSTHSDPLHNQAPVEGRDHGDATETILGTPPSPRQASSSTESPTPPPPPSPKLKNDENTSSHKGSSSIRLSSLFKSLPSPPKPKKGS